MLTTQGWHERYTVQARWTASVRRFLFQKAGIDRAKAILEVGSGTGAILADLCAQSPASVIGIDYNFSNLRFAKKVNPGPGQVCANAFHMPFASQSFSATCCHYFLLWIADPLQAVLEMKRVTQSGGAILALAEPDYGGRIDYPAVLAELGASQFRALRQSSADPTIGRKLKGIFHQAGLRSIEAGIIGAQWSNSPSIEEWSSEWRVLEDDLQGLLPAQKLAELKKQDQLAVQSGERILFVPTFFAFGLV